MKPKPLLTQQRLKELLHYDPDTGVFTRISSRLSTCVNKPAGGINYDGYRRIYIDGKSYFAQRLAFLYVHGSWSSFQMDHINGKRDDNRMSNLREATSSENKHNQVLSRKNKSGVKGVGWHRSAKKWQARVMLNGKDKYLGLFKNIEDAAAAAREARNKFHGKFANSGVSSEEAL